MYFLPETNLESAKLLAERIRVEITKIALESESLDIIKITTSLGISAYTKDINSYDILSDYADKALYLAKGNGRNQIKVYQKNS